MKAVEMVQASLSLDKVPASKPELEHVQLVFVSTCNPVFVLFLVAMEKYLIKNSSQKGSCGSWFVGIVHRGGPGLAAEEVRR